MITVVHHMLKKYCLVDMIKCNTEVKNIFNLHVGKEQPVEFSSLL